MITRKQYRNAKETVHYFDKSLQQSDYHTDNGKVIGTWFGAGAKTLNLGTEVKRADFERLINNINPNTDKRLTARSVKNRTVAEDWTFSVPKSVSIQHAITGDKEIIESVNKAVRETLAEVERDAETRVRVGGKYDNRKTNNIIAASFLHDDSRPIERDVNGKRVAIPDPQLHVHNVLVNATFDKKEQKWKAVQFKNMVASLPYYREVFNGHLAQNLQAVGYELERTKHNFKIKNYSNEVVRRFSNRTKIIEAVAAEKGIIDPAAKAALGAKTRISKRKGLSPKELHKFRLSQLSIKELKVIERAKNKVPKKPDKTRSKDAARQAVEYAIEHGLARKSVVEHRELLRHALNKGKVTTTKKEIEIALNEHKDLISKKTPNGMLYTHTIAHIEEKKLIAETRNGKGKFKPINPQYKIQNKRLTKEQKAAVHHAINSKDFITIINGRAGTGKTWSVKEIAHATQDAGLPFNGYATSSEASRRVQREEGFQNATTIAELLVNEKCHKVIKGGVIWLDEAGMVGNETMNKVINIAKANKARILLTGDTRQHNSVERGDAMRLMQQYGHVKSASISKNQRQKNDQYRAAVNAISEGRMASGFKTLDKMGAIKETPDYDALSNAVAEEYIEAVKTKENTLVIATTHKQIGAVNEKIRSKLKAEKLLDAQDINFTSFKNLNLDDAQKKDPIQYQAGNVVEFHQNHVGGFGRGKRYEVFKVGEDGKILIRKAHRQDKNDKCFILPMDAGGRFSVYKKTPLPLAKNEKIRMSKSGFTMDGHRIENGDSMTIKGFTHDGHIKASTGRKNITIHKNFGHVTHAYCMTSPKSQGKTVNKVIIMQGSMSGKASNMEQFYVSSSRAKFSVSVHTQDKAELLHNIKRSSKRMAAMEVAGEKKNEVSLGETFRDKNVKPPKTASSLNTDWQQKGESLPKEQTDDFNIPPPPLPNTPKPEPDAPSL